MPLHESRILRRVVLPLLSRLNLGDIHIRHHYTGDRIRLHSFRHKGYWFHGRNRERETMLLFEKLIAPGDSVCEVGGHIGYISLYFRQLARDGLVVVFEPGANNLPYLRANVAGRNIEIVEMAAGDTTGNAQFFLDSLTGQNNSLVRDFERLKVNERSAFVSAQVSEVTVPVIRLDEFFARRGFAPRFLKIDVEGFEWGVLRGSSSLLRDHHPALMVEVQANAPEIFDFLRHLDYVLFNPARRRLDQPADLADNVFALHREHHRRQLAELSLAPA